MMEALRSGGVFNVDGTGDVHFAEGQNDGSLRSGGVFNVDGTGDVHFLRTAKLRKRR